MADQKPPRTYRKWEEEMLAEYLAAYHPECRVFQRVRLGPIGPLVPDSTLSAEEQRMLGGSFRRWADAVCIEAGQLLVIETKMMPDPRDISQILLYLDLVEVTPELSTVKDLPHRGILVWPVDDPYSNALAVKHGLEVRIFKPSHYAQWLSTIRARESRPARVGLPPQQLKLTTAP
jgi:hypothetical protein